MINSDKVHGVIDLPTDAVVTVLSFSFLSVCFDALAPGVDLGAVVTVVECDAEVGLL